METSRAVKRKFVEEVTLLTPPASPAAALTMPAPAASPNRAVAFVTTSLRFLWHFAAYVPERLLRKLRKPAQILPVPTENGSKRRAVEVQMPGAFPHTPVRSSRSKTSSPRSRPLLPRLSPPSQSSNQSQTPHFVPSPTASVAIYAPEEHTTTRTAQSLLDAFIYTNPRQRERSLQAAQLDQKLHTHAYTTILRPRRTTLTPLEVWHGDSEPFVPAQPSTTIRPPPSPGVPIEIPQIITAEASPPPTPPSIVAAVDCDESFLPDAPIAKPRKKVAFRHSLFNGNIHPDKRYYIKQKPIGYPSFKRLSPEKRHFQSPRDPPYNADDSILETPIRFPNHNVGSPLNPAPFTPIADLLDSFHFDDEPQTPELQVSDSVRKRRAEILAAEEKKRNELKEKLRLEAERLAAKRAAKEAAEKKAKEEEEARVVAEAAAAAAKAAATKITIPLSAEWNDKVDSALANKPADMDLTRTIKRHDFVTLLPLATDPSGGPKGWLNDAIINEYVGYLVARALEKAGHDKRSGNPPLYHAFSSQWYSTVSQKGVEAVARWSKRAKLDGEKILQTEKILFPINSGAHWTLLVISGRNRTIEYLDSLHGAGRTYIETAKRWLRSELQGAYVDEEWKVLIGGSPKQMNMKDCGVFTCFNAVAQIRGLDSLKVFGPNDMENARRQVAATLLHGSFTGDFDWE